MTAHTSTDFFIDWIGKCGAAAPPVLIIVKFVGIIYLCRVGVAIVGSGMATHNMRARGISPASDAAARMTAFSRWLTETVTDDALDAKERRSRYRHIFLFLLVVIVTPPPLFPFGCDAIHSPVP